MVLKLRGWNKFFLTVYDMLSFCIYWNICQRGIENSHKILVILGSHIAGGNMWLQKYGYNSDKIWCFSKLNLHTKSTTRGKMAGTLLLLWCRPYVDFSSVAVQCWSRNLVISLVHKKIMPLRIAMPCATRWLDVICQRDKWGSSRHSHCQLNLHEATFKWWTHTWQALWQASYM